MPSTIRPLPFVASLVALVLGGAFLYVAGSVALQGTGAAIPTGPDVVEGTLVEGTSVRVPAGAPMQYGNIVVTDPAASRAVDHHFSAPVGEPEVRVATAEGERTIRLPPADDWKGPVEEETLQIDSLVGVPVVDEYPEIGERQGPPYLIIVKGLRTGDAIVAQTDGDEVVELHVGSREQLEAFLEQREAMRWPMVGLMAIVGLTSLILAAFAFRKARAPKVEGDGADEGAAEASDAE